ncbi:hypothetical protein KQX54_013934 [Cotesia glomerata]|uniref:Uncharacterized protein n=1 Tax=Cotesia glomerata TaxID=32391 RepID=A0AAV7HXQ1_COTGL|nr:hypothetical protein KQX54_013934 [Cotesia glomerata]
MPIKNTSQNIDTIRTSVNESIERFEKIAKKFGNVRGVAPAWIRGSTKPATPLTADPQWVQFPKTPPSKEVIREVKRSLTTSYHPLNLVSNEKEDRTVVNPTNPDSNTDNSENENEITELIAEEDNSSNDNTSTASEPDDTVISTEIDESSLASAVPVPEENIRLAPETPTLIRSMLKNFETQGIQWDPSSGKIIDISTHQGSTPYRPFADETVIAQRRNRLSELPTFNIDDNPEACSSVMEDDTSPNQTATVPRAKKRVTFGEPSTSEQPVPAIENPQQKPNSSTESASDTSETPVQLTNKTTVHKNSQNDENRKITQTTAKQQAEINLPPSESSSSEEELAKKYTTRIETPSAEPRPTSAIKFLYSRDGLTYEPSQIKIIRPERPRRQNDRVKRMQHKFYGNRMVNSSTRTPTFRSKRREKCNFTENRIYPRNYRRRTPLSA